MESWLRPLSVICTRGFSRLEMQRSFARTSSAHSTLAKVVQSISRCTNTCYIFLAHNTNNHPPLWSWRTKFAIILIDVKTTFINSPTLNWAANMIFYTPFSLHRESCVMRHFQEFLLAIDVASFGPVYISQWNTQGKTPVGLQVLFLEIYWKWSISINFFDSGDFVKINCKDLKCAPFSMTEMVWSTSRTVWQRLCSRWTSEYEDAHRSQPSHKHDILLLWHLWKDFQV